MKCRYCKKKITYKQRRSICCSSCRTEHKLIVKEAMAISKYLITIGELRKRPDKCELCGENEYVAQLHHLNYKKPNLIEWLCPECHTYRHEQTYRRLKIEPTT